MTYAVSEITTLEQATAVIAEETTWRAFPELWPVLLAEVWAAVRTSDRIRPNRNVMLYRDDVPNVEIGVEVAEAIVPVGRVQPGTLPAGGVATATHRGPYEEVGSAHEAIIAWCERNGLERAGPRWEIYGHATKKVADQVVDVYYLLNQ